MTRDKRKHVSALKWTFVALCLVLVGLTTIAVLEFYVWTKVPPALTGKWKVQEGGSSAVFEFFRNGTLQGGYFILAARCLGLDCGPMSGFDNAKVDAEFFPSGDVKSNFLCNLGYGDRSKLLPRNPRLDFDEACTFL